jgi:hypothetical protein
MNCSAAAAGAFPLNGRALTIRGGDLRSYMTASIYAPKEGIMISLLLVVVSSSMVLWQDVDLAGTWAGDVPMPGLRELDHLTLILERNGDSYSARLSDRAGIVQDAPLKDVTCKNGHLRFKVFLCPTFRFRLLIFAKCKISS